MATRELLAKNVTRILTGLIVGFSALFLLMYAGLPLFLFFTIIIVLAGKEYINIVETKGFSPSKFVVYASVLTFSLVAFLLKSELLLPLILLFSILAFLVVIFGKVKSSIVNISSTIMGVIYCAFLPCHILLLRDLGVEKLSLYETNYSLGYDATMLMLFTVVATDVGGWYFGSRFGKNSLCPEISPKKTIEGAVYGTMFAVFVATIVGLFLAIPLVYSVIGGLLISVSAQFGDLSESLLKRDSGIKDSSQALPGHGGFLDRIDGYFFAAPVAYYYFKIFLLNAQINVVPYLSWTKISAFLGF